MATITTTSQITISTDEENRFDSNTDLKILRMNYMPIPVLGPLPTKRSCSTGLSFVKSLSAFLEREPPSKQL